ncbi:uncharacterized protein [Drosophila virilis]|uniref:Uncharacterized protein, isoform A n=1 Tax=Drosophila virilis TaxID=7244 RepID=B4M7E6_DROVI|nr:uncharacterized protein LOC6633509 isoform X3 [Drosophila virilis]EDW62713.2 uncharacterized protein Dvir_GJ16465, isoform A [Drosophila virilis]
MSLKRYKNPVNNHFIYNDEIRKSTCKVCLFDMAGRHSENLMRHLKRKHPATYAEVMLEKQRRRSANTNRSSGSDTGPLSSMFKFETQPHKLFIKSMPIGAGCGNDYEEDTSSLNGNGQFESVDIGKEELCEVVHSPEALNDSSESFIYPDNPNDEDPFIMTNFAQANTMGSPSTNSTPAAQTGNNSNNATPSCSMHHSSNDASFLQYLSDKFGKYSSNTKYTVQYHINCILYKADMGCYDNADASKLPDSYA